MHSYSKKEKLILILCTIFYLFCLVSLVLFNRIATLLLLILHSSLILYFFYLQSIPSTSLMTESSEDPDDSLSLIDDLNNKILFLNSTISEKDIMIKTLEENIIDHKSASDPETVFSPINIILPHSVYNQNQLEPINIISIAQKAIDELSLFASKAHIQVQISSATDQVNIKADALDIQILFRNIIDNAIKYMNCPGSLVITISIIGTDVFIICKDNGSGLSEQETSHIFELNYQGSNRIDGNGLGLTQAQAIVNSYGGIIYAKSILGKGMAIYIQLPLN